MCGFAGYLELSTRTDAAERTRTLERMAGAIRHRGPDDAGTWLDPDAGVGLAHRRLSILDLSPAGRQPMFSNSGRYVLVFNGEIYNHLALRKELGAGVQWRGHSDTETWLAGFEAWGIEATLKRSVGMFACALWDRAERALYLARDRFGEKPLYVGRQNGVVLFGSDLGALRQHPAFRGVIDRDALTLLLRHGFVPAPYSIYRDVWKLPPATFLKLLPSDADGNADLLRNRIAYWSLAGAVDAGRRNPFRGDEPEAVDLLEATLREAAGLQMVADVPLGAFLSGGVDSSTVVALMQSQSPRPVKTFTIGFHEEMYDEARHARRVAGHLGTDHTELYVTPKEAMDVIPSLPSIYCEPFADPSQIPTLVVSTLARQHVTISLSGDGGDELFGGYNRYLYARELWRGFARMPRPARVATAGLLTALSPSAWNRAFRLFHSLFPGRLNYANPGEKAYKLAAALRTLSPEDIYLRLLSQWENPEDVVIDGREPMTPFTAPEARDAHPDFESRMMLMDSLCYLPDDILVKVDRAAMAVSLETRVPFLDHRVVELAWRLPLSMKIRNGSGKWLLRQVLFRHVPARLIERPKMGFGVPIDSWLRGPLREWAESLLEESRLRNEGFFRPEPIRQKWAEHLSGSANWQYPLWNVLMFQAWRASQA